MRIKVKSAILHSPMFVNGSNLSDKIGEGVAGSKPCEIWYDDAFRMLVVKYKGTEVWTSVDGGVASFIPAQEQPQNPVPTPPAHQEPKLTVLPGPPAPMTAGPLPRDPAQVEVPTQPKTGRTKNAA